MAKKTIRTKARAKPTSAKTGKVTTAKCVRTATTGRFVAAKTGRVLKSSPVVPRLGEDRIQKAVESVVSKRD